MLRSSNTKPVIYDTTAPASDTRLGQLFVDIDASPPTLYICTSLTPVTFVPVGSGGGGGQATIQFKDDGTNLGTSGTADTVDFVGAGVTATRVGNTITVTVSGGGGGLPPDGDYGDITVSGAGTVWTIDTGVVTLAKMAGLGANTFIGRATGAGVPQELTATQATAQLDLFTSALKGLTPLSGGGTDNFLRADGTWASPNGTNASINASWNFDTSTVAADPGNRDFRLNNATPASVTAVYLNDTAVAGFDAGTLLSILATGNRIYLQQNSDATRYLLLQVTGAATDNTGWWTVPVSVVASGSLPTSSATCSFVFVLSSAAGAGTNLSWTASTRTVASDTGTDAVITLFTSADAGLVPASGGGTSNFLRADGTFAAPPGGGTGLTSPQVLARTLGS